MTVTLDAAANICCFFVR